ncbi:HD-GYP domain-containing protein [Paenibacillus tarimensis]|uniref:HD-GYP domain-containing protein n=1 Tax=Paenibacillus tarimensis TaxID=416012 RepID=UPI001F3C3EAC|nr:HD domain-containing phosphohydrolase [Paenibacillus tarimensis]MCF2944951.1 HD domain-containing protein [Paenibacillus tarimensis]
MMVVPVRKLREGDRLGAPVYFNDGRVLMPKGTVLNISLITVLGGLNVDTVLIDNMAAGQKQSAYPVQKAEELQRAAYETVLQVFRDVERSGSFQGGAVMGLATELAAFAIEAPVFPPVERLEGDGSKWSELAAHSAYVCMLAVATGRQLPYTGQHLKMLAIGSLLHDIGYITDKDRAQSRLEHPQKGYDMIRRLPDLPLLSAHIVLEHHEELSGKGFPRGLRGDQVRLSAQICGIANAFDRYRHGEQLRSFNEGIEHLLSKIEISYDGAAVRAFIQAVSQ